MSSDDIIRDLEAEAMRQRLAASSQFNELLQNILEATDSLLCAPARAPRLAAMDDLHSRATGADAPVFHSEFSSNLQPSTHLDKAITNLTPSSPSARTLAVKSLSATQKYLSYAAKAEVPPMVAAAASPEDVAAALRGLQTASTALKYGVNTMKVYGEFRSASSPVDLEVRLVKEGAKSYYGGEVGALTFELTGNPFLAMGVAVLTPIATEYVGTYVAEQYRTKVEPAWERMYINLDFEIRSRLMSGTW